jgi:hypothetical protein
MTAIPDYPWGSGPKPQGWDEYQLRKAGYVSRVAIACGTYQDNNPEALAELRKDEARQARKTARRESGELTEHEHQALVVEWLEARGHRCFAICNGVVFGLPRDKAVRYASYLRAEGKRKGVPDLVICPPRGSRVMCALEMKSIKGTVSDEQHEWLDYLESVGWKVLIAWGHEQAIQRLEEAGY